MSTTTTTSRFRTREVSMRPTFVILFISSLVLSCSSDKTQNGGSGGAGGALPDGGVTNSSGTGPGDTGSDAPVGDIGAIIPADRRVDWKNTTGVPGGIP